MPGVIAGTCASSGAGCVMQSGTATPPARKIPHCTATCRKLGVTRNATRAPARSELPENVTREAHLIHSEKPLVLNCHQPTKQEWFPYRSSAFWNVFSSSPDTMRLPNSSSISSRSSLRERLRLSAAFDHRLENTLHIPLLGIEYRGSAWNACQRLGQGRQGLGLVVPVRLYRRPARPLLK